MWSDAVFRRNGKAREGDGKAPAAHVCLPSNNLSAFPWSAPAALCQLRTVVPSVDQRLSNLSPNRSQTAHKREWVRRSLLLATGAGC
jgi:hypothetical protein